MSHHGRFSPYFQRIPRLASNGEFLSFASLKCNDDIAVEFSLRHKSIRPEFSPLHYTGAARFLYFLFLNIEEAAVVQQT